MYDSSCTLAENVELTDPILQRFDVLCVLQDTIDPIADEALARFVVNSHRRSHKHQKQAKVDAVAATAADEAESEATTVHASSGNSFGGLGGGGNGGGSGSGGGDDDSDDDNTIGDDKLPERGSDRGGAETTIETEMEARARAPPTPPTPFQSQGILNDRGEESISQELLQKYIQYARSNCMPQLRGIEEAKIAQLYADLRRESATAGGVPIAVRHIESVLRMSEAHAKMHLRDHVRDDDVDAAIRVMLESFIMAQKFSVRRSLRRGFQPYLAEKQDYNELLLHALRQLAADEQEYQKMRLRRLPDSISVVMDDLEARAREYRVYDLTQFYESEAFKHDGFQIRPHNRTIFRSF